LGGEISRNKSVGGTILERCTTNVASASVHDAALTTVMVTKLNGAKAVKPAHRVPANRFFHLPKPARGGNQTVPLR
jgi:hypothetical protein